MCTYSTSRKAALSVVQRIEAYPLSAVRACSACAIVGKIGFSKFGRSNPITPVAGIRPGGT